LREHGCCAAATLCANGAAPFVGKHYLIKLSSDEKRRLLFFLLRCSLAPIPFHPIIKKRGRRPTGSIIMASLLHGSTHKKDVFHLRPRAVAAEGGGAKFNLTPLSCFSF